MSDEASLRRAIETTNAEPGAYTIRFAVETISLREHLPPLTGGGVTIEAAGVTLRPRTELKWGLWLASGGNEVHGLTLERFTHGVLVQPDGMPVRQTYAGTVISGLTMRSIGTAGIWIVSALSPRCGAPKTERCRTFHCWTNTTIRNNTIEARATGIKVQLNNVGDRFEHATVTGNRITVREEDAGIALETSGDSLGARISDVTIARNSIAGGPGVGINLVAGALRGQNGIVEEVRVLDNRLSLGGSGFCCAGIAVQAGTDHPSFTSMVRPPRYLDGNVVRNVVVRGNTVVGRLVAGVTVNAGTGAGGRRNRVQNVRIDRNTIRSSTVASGVNVVTGGGTPFRNRYATRNRITGVSVAGNRITIGRANPLDTVDLFLGGVVLVGGGTFGRDNVIRGIRIASNRIATALAGIKLVGGFSPTARRNSVSCVRISGTRASVSVRANVGGASGNRATLSC